MNPTPGDAIQLMNGKPFSVRNGEIPTMYFTSESECLIHADRSGMKAYVAERDGSRKHSTQITLRQIFGYPSDQKTPSEQIAASVRGQLSPDASAPLSPLSKERAIRLLHSSCRDKGLSFESYKILYPYSNQEQFDRIWMSLDSSGSKMSPSEILEQFASSRGCLVALPYIIDGLSIEVTKFQIDIKAVIEVSDMCVKLGMCDRVKSDKLCDDLKKFDSASRIESSIGPSMSALLSKHPLLRRMVVNGNSSGAIEYLQESLGFDRKDSNDLYEELSALATMVARQV